MSDGRLKISGMPRKPTKGRSREKIPPPPIYVGAWLRRLGLKQADIARAVPMNEGYLSSIVNNERYPDTGMFHAIARAMGIPAHYLYRLPPDAGVVAQVSDIDPATLSRLRPH